MSSNNELNLAKPGRLFAQLTLSSSNWTVAKAGLGYPGAGEVWLVDLGLAAKVRPALVLSVRAGDQDRALVTLVPHTTSIPG